MIDRNVFVPCFDAVFKAGMFPVVFPRELSAEFRHFGNGFYPVRFRLGRNKDEMGAIEFKFNRPLDTMP